MMARVAVTSSTVACSARRPGRPVTRSVLDALGMTSKHSAPTHHTMMSSSTEASASSSRWVYWARPGPMLVQVVGEGPLQPVEGLGPLDPDGAEVAHVEGDGAVAAGPVLGQRAVRVAERHVPAPERHHLGVQGPVGGVERRGAQGHRGEASAAGATGRSGSGGGASGPEGGQALDVRRRHLDVGPRRAPARRAGRR